MRNLIRALLIAVGVTQSAPAQNATLIRPITNPNPAATDWFGYSVTAVGSDRVLVGAYLDDVGALNAGAAYLFNTDGDLLHAFYNPAPASNDHFGYSVAAIGNDRILIGAVRDTTQLAGAAHLFTTNGVLVRTFNNPTPYPGDSFGGSMAAVGNDRILIGAPGDNADATGAGIAYLFNTNGILLTTFYNPAPGGGDHFGIAVSAVGNDHVLVGAPGVFIGAPGVGPGAIRAGSAYLFHADGTLVTTFADPSPGTFDEFGNSVAAMGSDRVLIGAYGDSTGASYAGVAFLFATNGTLLTTYTNPAPAAADSFGRSVASPGNGWILISADQDNTGLSRAGAAYLFDTNATLLATIANPSPTDSAFFGLSMVALGSDLVFIGAPRDDAGATDSGAAYLFALSQPDPTLLIAPATTGTAVISWVPNTPGFVLQETEALAPANWTNSLSGSENPTVAPHAPPGKYFRLLKP